MQRKGGGHREGTLTFFRRSKKLLEDVLLPSHHFTGAFGVWGHFGCIWATNICSEYRRGVDACVWTPCCVSSCLHSSA